MTVNPPSTYVLQHTAVVPSVCDKYMICSDLNGLSLFTGNERGLQVSVAPDRAVFFCGIFPLKFQNRKSRGVAHFEKSGYKMTYCRTRHICGAGISRQWRFSVRIEVVASVGLRYLFLLSVPRFGRTPIGLGLQLRLFSPDPIGLSQLPGFFFHLKSVENRCGLPGAQSLRQSA